MDTFERKIDEIIEKLNLCTLVHNNDDQIEVIELKLDMISCQIDVKKATEILANAVNKLKAVSVKNKDENNVAVINESSSEKIINSCRSIAA